jgi:hypothetical protein
MFVTYLTEYSGNKLPPFYIGSTSATRLATGYHGSVRSEKWAASRKKTMQSYKGNA